MSVIPSASLLAIASTWRFWPIGWKEVPATAFSLGLSLLMLVVAVVAEYVVGVTSFLDQGPVTLLASLAIVYGTGLLVFSRREGVKPWRLGLVGVLGLVPAYHLVGYTLINSVCGIQSAGC
jgi:hypothetical protein